MSRLASPLLALASLSLLAGCASTTRTTPSTPGTVVEGLASYYSDKFEGRPTASGEPYRADNLTAAHRTLPFGTRVRVTHLKSGKSVVVRVNDRGPNRDDRIIDLSGAAARLLGMVSEGVARVRVEVLP